MKNECLDGKNTHRGFKKMHNSIVIISFVALLSVVIILTTVTTSLVDDFPSTLSVFLKFNIKSVEASSEADSPSTPNTTSTADAPQSTSDRSYVNPVFGISVKYPSTWSAFDLNSRFRDNVTYAVALLRSPLDNASDKFAERINFAMQNLKVNNMTLDSYTSKILDAYKNITGIKIQESGATTLGGEPAHKIVYTDDSQNDTKLKKIQVWTVVNKSKPYVITFASEASKYNEHVPDIQKILSSFEFTGGNSDNPQEERNLMLDDSMSGIKLEYPSSWIKIQPGQRPQSNVDIVAAFLRPEVENKSAISRIGIGVQDLRQDVTLDQYTPNQINAIKNVNGTISESESGETEVGNNPGHKAVFTLENGKKVMQVWTLKGNKAYLMAYQATPDEFSKNLPAFEKMVESIQIK